MFKLNKNQRAILLILGEKGALSSSGARGELTKRGEDISLVTVKRLLAEMKTLGLIESTGAGRAVTYTVSSLGRMFATPNAAAYCALEPDKRYGAKNYNFALFDATPGNLFSAEEMAILEEATAAYRQKVTNVSLVIREKELERFIIELSWKSSKIEGNTYTLLDTQKLIERGVEALGHDKKEMSMILNHKNAFKFAREHLTYFKKLNKAGLEEIHKILVKDLDVNSGWRQKPVGITGSIYRPLDNQHQITEAVTALINAANRAKNVYTKALITLAGVGYVQPFEDGNKRAARLMANALLIADGGAPLSYRSVDENVYREATFVFYELNSIMPLKKIFIEQYLFATENYLVV